MSGLQRISGIRQTDWNCCSISFRLGFDFVGDHVVGEKRLIEI